MQYQVLFDITAAGLAERVQKSLNAGWDLHGSIAIAFIGEAIGFAQAITNEDDDAPLTLPPEPPIDHKGLAEFLEVLLKRAEERKAETEAGPKTPPDQDSQP